MKYFCSSPRNRTFVSPGPQSSLQSQCFQYISLKPSFMLTLAFFLLQVRWEGRMKLKLRWISFLQTKFSELLSGDVLYPRDQVFIQREVSGRTSSCQRLLRTFLRSSKENIWYSWRKSCESWGQSLLPLALPNFYQISDPWLTLSASGKQISSTLSLQTLGMQLVL